MGAPLVANSRWLYGPIPDLLLGCGLLYLAIAAAFALAGDGYFRGLPAVLPAVLIAATSAPHYGATLLRVYENSRDRRAYFLFGGVATGGLLLLFGAALFNRYVGSVLATIYLTWSGWHYMGQNYGIAAMFLRRRGADLDGTSRRLLRGSFVLSYLIVFLDMHAAQAPLADPSLEIRLVPLALPRAFTAGIMPAVTVAYLASTVAWIVRLGPRSGGLSGLAPVLAIAGVQAFWWSIPFGLHHFGIDLGVVPLAWDLRPEFFAWIACAHAIQYLWVSSYFAKSSGNWRGQGRYYAGALMAGSAVWALPPLVFAPGVGEFDWNFALLLGAVVNIHHFILDGVIWRLRHSKIADVLILGQRDLAANGSAPGWSSRLVWGVAALAVVVVLHGLAERYVVTPWALRTGRYETVLRSLDRQAWHGTNTLVERFRVGQGFEKQGRFADAIAQYEICFGIEKRVEPIRRLILLYREVGDAEGFVRSCDRLFGFEGVTRPMESPVVASGGSPVPRDFQRACIRTAQQVRPGRMVGQSAAPTGERLYR
jgi:hypothetical protein